MRQGSGGHRQPHHTHSRAAQEPLLHRNDSHPLCRQCLNGREMKGTSIALDQKPNVTRLAQKHVKETQTSTDLEGGCGGSQQCVLTYVREILCMLLQSPCEELVGSKSKQASVATPSWSSYALWAACSFECHRSSAIISPDVPVWGW